MAIDGLDKVLRNLRELPVRAKKNALVRSVRKGANVVRNKARGNAAKVDDKLTPEVISKNIVTQYASKTSRATGDTVFRVGVMGGAKQYGNTRLNRRRQRVGKTYETTGGKGNPGGDTWYWRFLEFGTSKMAAKPILRPAAEEGATEAFEVVAQDLERQIALEVSKLRGG